jgi:hypothetical protein
MIDLIERNKQRRDWLDWYAKTRSLLDIFAQEEKRKPLTGTRAYDWNRRHLARAFGFDVGPQLVGDAMAETKAHGIAHVQVIDDFGTVRGWTIQRVGV